MIFIYKKKFRKLSQDKTLKKSYNFTHKFNNHFYDVSRSKIFFKLRLETSLHCTFIRYFHARYGFSYDEFNQLKIIHQRKKNSNFL